MKKRNISIQAAIAILLGSSALSSIAGTTSSVPIGLATQAVISNTTAIRTGTVLYTTQAALAVSVVNVRVTLGNGAKFVGAAGTTVVAGALTTAAANTAVGAGVISADQLSVNFPVTVTVAPVAAGAIFVFRPVTTAATDGSVNNVGYLAAVGGTLPVSISIGSSAAVTGDVDSVSTSSVVSSVSGITTTVLASNAPTFVAQLSGGAIETKRIQVATGAGITTLDGATGNTQGTANLINFGGFSFVNVGGVVAADGVTAFTMATNYAGGASTLGATLTGNFGAAAGTGGKVFLASNSTCTTQVGNSAVISGATATISGVTTPLNAVSSFVCMQVNTPNNTITIPVTTPILVTAVTGTAATTSSLVSASTSLFPLVNNGSLIRVNTYVPASSVGYSSFIRVINTGGATAAVSAAVVDQVTGIAGSPAVIIPSLVAGGSVTLTSTQIEAAVGTISASGNRPTLQVTAPAALAVQSFLLSPNGTFTLVSGQEF